MTTQLVTIITPYYNDELYLGKAIDSVLSQSYCNFELILVNHASTDSSREIAHSYIDKRIRHIDMPRNEGWSTMLTLKTALDESKGRYIKILCADDMLHKECLKEFINFFTTHNCDICFSDVNYIDKNGVNLNNTWFNSRKYFNINDSNHEMIQKFMFGFSFLPFAGAFLKKNILDNIKINPSYIMLADMSLWLQALIQGSTIKFIKKSLTSYRIHSGQISALKNKKNVELASYFEYFSYYQFIYTMRDIEQLKIFFSSSKYINLVNFEIDIDREFIISEFLLRSFDNEQRIIGYTKIFTMINNDQQREYLLKKFGFGIKEYRQLYSQRMNDVNSNYPISIISKIQQKNISDLNARDLGLLLLRRIWLQLPIKIRKIIKPSTGNSDEYSL